MKLSVIVATRNRAQAITPCLNSIADALANAAPLDAQIIVVDNGSTDDTPAILNAWASTSPFPCLPLSEPITGKARALNRALRAADGEIFAFTDDDCRLSEDYANDLLRHHAADTQLVLRGGRVELGDPTDLPFTIDTNPNVRHWSRAANSARHENLAGVLAGCNMTAHRALVERLGPFDENFGPGSVVGSGEDTDYIYRAYLAGAILEYVPDMTVFHFHGRKTPADGVALFRRYMIGSGGLNMKYILRYPNFCRQTYWDLKAVLKETVTRRNTFMPEIGFSHKDKLRCVVRGALRYLLFAPKFSETWAHDFLRANPATGQPTLPPDRAMSPHPLNVPENV
jgi:glycosyltransferase involved in cell wall biosynthesis